jgi:hypothetical protein
MAEAMLAHPPSYFWLERSLHVNPVKSIGSAVFGPGNAKKMDLGRLLRAGEKVKGQTPSRKKPYAVPRRVACSRCAPPVEKSDSA